MEIVGNISLTESRGTLEGYANPQERSTQDGSSFKYKDKRRSLWKARYSYAPKSNKNNSREFCKSMVDIAKTGLVYRKEDIVQMENDSVHSELAASGKTNYSIWLYKGGALCHHYWQRHIYVRRWNAVNIPDWINMVADLPIPRLDNKWAQAVSFIIINSTGLPLNDRKNMFANTINFKNFVETSARGYFQRYLAGLNIPAPIKATIFQRFGKTTNSVFRFFRSALKGRTIPTKKIYSKLPTTAMNLDFEDAGILFDELHSLLKGITKGSDRKIGVPMAKSKSKKLENDEEIAVREARKRAIDYPVNSGKVNTKPKDMINRGYMPTTRQRIRSTITKILR